jgi:hypothetical protein
MDEEEDAAASLGAPPHEVVRVTEPHGLRELAVPAITSFLLARLSDARWAQARLKAERERGLLLLPHRQARAERNDKGEGLKGEGADDRIARDCDVSGLVEVALAAHRDAHALREGAECALVALLDAERCAGDAEQRAALATHAVMTAAAVPHTRRSSSLSDTSTPAPASTSASTFASPSGAHGGSEHRPPAPVISATTHLKGASKKKSAGDLKKLADRDERGAELADVERKVLDVLLDAELLQEDWMFVSTPLLPFSGTGFKRRFGMPAYQWLQTLDSVETSHVTVGGAPRVRLRAAAELADIEARLRTVLSTLGHAQWMAVSQVITPGFRTRFGMRVYKWLETLDCVETEHDPGGGAQDRVRLKDPVRVQVAAELSGIETNVRAALSKLERDEWMAVGDPTFRSFRRLFGMRACTWLDTLDGMEAERAASGGGDRVRLQAPS